MVNKEGATVNRLDEEVTGAFFSVDELNPATCHPG